MPSPDRRALGPAGLREEYDGDDSNGSIYRQIDEHAKQHPAFGVLNIHRFARGVAGPNEPGGKASANRPG